MPDVNWDKSKSIAKATNAATPAAQGAVVGGGGMAGILAFVRATWPQALPWDMQWDTTLVGFAAFLVGPLWTWLRVYWRDKNKPHPAPPTALTDEQWAAVHCLERDIKGNPFPRDGNMPHHGPLITARLQNPGIVIMDGVTTLDPGTVAEGKQT